MIGSQYNRLLTLEYLRTEEENKYFDRKSGKIKPSDLAKHISAFANADGGTIVIGISDNKAIEGINQFGESKINEFINAPRSGCKPMPRYEYELIDVINSKGESDRLLLL
ncbi:MAG: ATP-binding protein, partial [Eubacteriales bacterium]|nr:ATP-binding protein [Eubacteriales bacterium]